MLKIEDLEQSLDNTYEILKSLEKRYPKVKNEQIIKYFKSLKKEYQFALITTNTKSALERILSVANLENLFDIIETSLPEEKDDKILVFNRFIKKHKNEKIFENGD